MIPGSNLLRTCGQLFERAALGTAAAALCAAAASAQTIVLKAELTGAQVVPPVTTTGMGTAWFLVDLDANTITFDLTYDQLSGTETGAQIEGFAAAGSNGTSQFTLGPGKHKTGTWSYTPADEQSILDGMAYVVIQSSANPAGELRGQIEVAAAHRVLVASFDGAQVVPPVTTTATATGIFMLNTQTNVMTYQITYADLSSAETGAHLHGYVPAGQTSASVHDLPTGFHKTGTWTYTQANEANILQDLVYADVETTNNPTGEIRGQLELEFVNAQPYCTAKANSQACTPTIGFTGTPTLSGADNFDINATNVLNQSMSALYWSPLPDNAPFLNGTMCLSAPPPGTSNLLGVEFSAGTVGPPDCTGNPNFDFTHAQMTALGLTPGDVVFLQYWYRDITQSDGTGFGSTDALVTVILP
jgi:hypothetical protein